MSSTPKLPLAARLGWFALYWLASIATLAVVASVLRWAIG